MSDEKQEEQTYRGVIGKELKDKGETVDYIKMGLFIAIGNAFGIPIANGIIELIKHIVKTAASSVQ